MKYIILVLWTFSLFLLMFSSFPFRVECRPSTSSSTTRQSSIMGSPGRPQSSPLILLPSVSSSSGSSNTYFNQNNHHQQQHLTTTTTCPVLEGPSASRFNPWPDLYIPDITAKVWESPIVLEGTARSRSEVRADGTFGVTFDLHRVVKGDAPLLRRRRQFRLQFLDNPNPSLDNSNRDRDFLGGGRKNPNKNHKVSNSSTSSFISSSTNKSSSRNGGSSNTNNNRNNNNINNIYNSHSNPRSSSSSLTTKQLHYPPPSSSVTSSTSSFPSSSQAHQLQLYQQQRQRQLMAQQQQLQFRQSQNLRPTPQTARRNVSIGWGSSTNFRPSTISTSNRNLGGGGNGRSGRTSRSMAADPPGSNKCVPPKATVKTGRKYYVFAAKVENHFIAVFSPELVNKRNTKGVEGILCKGCGQAPSVMMAAKDVQLIVKERVRLRCRLRAGNPIPLLTWYKDGRPVNLTDTRFRLRTKRRQSILVIRKAREIDVGIYRCEGKNVFGSAYASVRVSLAPPGSDSTTSAAAGSRPKSTNPKPANNPNNQKRPSSSKTVETTATTLWPLEARECPYDSYCLNGGTCSYFETIGEFVCQCTEGFKGQRCDTKDISSSSNSGGDYESTRRLLNLWD